MSDYRLRIDGKALKKSDQLLYDYNENKDYELEYIINYEMSLYAKYLSTKFFKRNESKDKYDFVGYLLYNDDFIELMTIFIEAVVATILNRKLGAEHYRGKRVIVERFRVRDLQCDEDMLITTVADRDFTLEHSFIKTRVSDTKIMRDRMNDGRFLNTALDDVNEALMVKRHDNKIINSKLFLYRYPECSCIRYTVEEVFLKEIHILTKNIVNNLLLRMPRGKLTNKRKSELLRHKNVNVTTNFTMEELHIFLMGNTEYLNLVAEYILAKLHYANEVRDASDKLDVYTAYKKLRPIIEFTATDNVELLSKNFLITTRRAELNKLSFPDNLNGPSYGSKFCIYCKQYKDYKAFDAEPVIYDKHSKEYRRAGDGLNSACKDCYVRDIKSPVLRNPSSVHKVDVIAIERSLKRVVAVAVPSKKITIVAKSITELIEKVGKSEDIETYVRDDILVIKKVIIKAKRIRPNRVKNALFNRDAGNPCATCRQITFRVVRTASNLNDISITELESMNGVEVVYGRPFREDNKLIGMTVGNKYFNMFRHNEPEDPATLLNGGWTINFKHIHSREFLTEDELLTNMVLEDEHLSRSKLRRRFKDTFVLFKKTFKEFERTRRRVIPF